MFKPNKKPKPAGAGNYKLCNSCNGFGFTIQGKKYTGNRIWAPNKTINLQLTCKQCLGSGWTTNT